MVRDDREMIQFTGERMVPIACGSDASAWAAIVGMSASAAGLLGVECVGVGWASEQEGSGFSLSL